MRTTAASAQHGSSGNDGAALAAAAACGLILALTVLVAAVDALTPLLLAQPAIVATGTP